MRLRRGRIVTREGTVHDVPPYLLDDEEILWPPGLAPKPPGAPAQLVGMENLYRRHEIVQGEAYLYLPDSARVEDVPQHVIDELTQG